MDGFDSQPRTRDFLAGPLGIIHDDLPRLTAVPPLGEFLLCACLGDDLQIQCSGELSLHRRTKHARHFGQDGQRIFIGQISLCAHGVLLVKRLVLLDVSLHQRINIIRCLGARDVHALLGQHLGAIPICAAIHLTRWLTCFWEPYEVHPSTLDRHGYGSTCLHAQQLTKQIMTACSLAISNRLSELSIQLSSAALRLHEGLRLLLN